MATKEQWPELTGKSGAEAEAKVKADRPDVQVQVMAEGSPCTMDYRTDRVRIFVDAAGNVAGTPMCG